MDTLKENTYFKNLDYRNVEIENGSVVYCDPPYANTTGYSNSNSFNHDEFWDYMRFLSKENIVFVSELRAPDDFVAIWQKPFKRVLDVDKDNIFESLEKLFIHRSLIEKYDFTKKYNFHRLAEPRIQKNKYFD